MSPNIRRFCAILVAFMAAASVAASPAAAITDDFEAEVSPYILTGKPFGKQVVLTFSSGAEMECNASGLNGTISSSPTQELTLQPTYSGCSMGGQAATVDTPCSNVFTGQTNAFEHGIVHIECAKEPVRITLNGCTVEVGAQTPEQGAHYTNGGSGTTRDVRFKVTMTNVLYTKAGLLCSLIGGLSGELSIVGEYTVQAFRDEGGAEGPQIGFWIKSTI